MKQGVLFTEPRFRRVCRDILLPAGLYSPAPVIIEAIVGLTPSDKAVYRAALHHLRGATTSVAVGLDRLAAMTAMSRRSASTGVARLHAAVLIDAFRYRPGGLWRIAFAPLDWWLAEHSRRVDPGLINRLMDIYAGESAITRFIESVIAPTPAPAETAPTDPTPAEAAPAQATAPPHADFSTIQENSAPPHADFSTIQENSAPPHANFAPKALTEEALTKEDLTSAAQRLSFTPRNETTDSGQNRRGQIRPDPSFEMAVAWEDMLNLPARTRTDEKEEADFQCLLDVAADVMGGKLGPVEATGNTLYTLAHQIGHRPTPARTPLGLFLTNGVGKLRIKAMRRNSVTKGK